MTRDAQLNMRVSVEERAAYHIAAGKAGLPLAGWIRVMLSAAAGERVLSDAFERVESASAPRQPPCTCGHTWD